MSHFPFRTILSQPTISAVGEGLKPSRATLWVITLLRHIFSAPSAGLKSFHSRRGFKPPAALGIMFLVLCMLGSAKDISAQTETPTVHLYFPSNVQPENRAIALVDTLRSNLAS